MPERNLVKGVVNLRCFMILVIGLTIISMQLGCSRLGQSIFSRDLLSDQKGQPSWSTDSSDSASRYVSDPYADLNATKQKDEARIVGIRESSDIDIKLTALQPSPAIGSATSDSKSASLNAFCEHADECDCHKPRIKPKLPYAEPIDPPPITAIAPPKELVNQPLTPILFDAQTREIQTAVVEDTSNSLRRNQQWSHEKVATLTSKQSGMDSATIDSNPIRLNPSEAQMSQPFRTTNLVRGTDTVEPTQTDDPDFQKQSLPVCVSCHEANCNGNCANRTRRTAASDLRPVVDSDPIKMVATTSTDSFPPFAECPPDDQVIEISHKLEIVIPEFNNPPESMVVDASSESFDDLSDDEWLKMFGSMNADGPSCPDCQSGQCQNPSCELKPETEIVVTEFPRDHVAAAQRKEVMNLNDVDAAPAPKIVDTQKDTNVAQASSIEAAPTAETKNDFQPVSHSAVVGKIEIEIELPSWFQPKIPDPLPIPPSIESSVLATEPVDDSKTVELPMFVDVPVSHIVHVPDGGKNLMPRQPQLYTGPQVRFEIIDNTVPWDVKLSETIQNVASQLADENEPLARNGLEVNLRLLEVLQRQMADVEVRKDSLSNEEKQYWQHQLDAITVMLRSTDDENSHRKRHSTAIKTLDHLRKAVERLESIADLRVSNGEFCTEVSGFGRFKSFPTARFASNQRMLVYCEIENYSSLEQQVNLQSEVRTRLQGSYVIYDQQGRAVQQAEYPIVEDIARKRRRDFYMHFPIQLDNLPSGQYKLELLIEDLNGNKTGSIEPELEFQVK